MSRFFSLFFVIDAVMILFFIFGEHYLELLNFEVGAISALLVVLASFFGYKKMVESKAEEMGEAIIEEPDTLEKIDDPYDLYDDDEVSDPKALYDREKRRIKSQSGIKNMFLSFKGLLSPFRILGYTALVIGFLWLNRHGMLEIFPYLGGLLLMPVSVLLFALFFKGKNV